MAVPAIGPFALLAAYLLGTFPSALLAGRRRGVDPTLAGSRNPGATNVLRTAGRRAAVLTLAGDVGKGALAAGLGWVAAGHSWGVYCGVAAVLGHVAPVNRGFRGGKGVATGFGMLVVVLPFLAYIGAVAFVATVVATRLVSVGSLAAEAIILFGAVIRGVPRGEVAALCVCGAVILVRHSDNIRRIVQGEERHISLRVGPRRRPE